ncbi:MAG: peptidoglycan DD-metalloendopeptidase family protein [Oscillospiraceae bacterium]|nr:peptidoglycan DD-metalloendopeptidase family protein [Oscillospiraceae bacterium]
MNQTRAETKSSRMPPPKASPAGAARISAGREGQNDTLHTSHPNRALVPSSPRPPAPVVPAVPAAAKSEKKLPPVQRLAHRFKKNGLGRLDSYFNARFFYYAWKGDKKGRETKDYIETVAKHPKGWGKNKEAGDVYEKNAYDRYMAYMTLIAGIWGFFGALFAPVRKFFRSAGLAALVKKAFAFLLTAGSAALTVAAIMTISSFTPDLELCFDGRVVGCVDSKATAVSAVSVLENNISSILGEPYEFTGAFEYRLVLTKTGRPHIPESELYDIIYNSPQVCAAVTTAYGLFIDGELVIAAESQNDIDRVLSELLEENSVDIGENGNIDFANNIEIIEDKYATRDVVSHDELKDIITYSAEPADLADETLYAVAEPEVPLFGGIEFFDYAASSSAAEDIAAIAAASSIELTPEVINTIPRGFLDTNEYNLQDDTLSRLMRTSGSTASGSLKFKKIITEGYNVAVPFETRYVDSELYYKGTQTIKTNGVNGENRVTAEVTYISDEEVSREIILVETLKAPIDKVVLVGTKLKPVAAPTGSFIRPVKGGYTTSRFGGGHRGVDLVVPKGTTISAADGGTVIYAGYSSSYGNHVKIKHNGGFVTLYAHLSSISVKYGDKVYQGQEIGKCGSTGNSTGPHLHFEIIKNGVLVNPESYMK